MRRSGIGHLGIILFLTAAHAALASDVSFSGACSWVPREQIARRLKSELELNSLPGIAVVIAGKPGICSTAFGVKDLVTRQPMTVGTPSDLASVSKSFTAAALWQLWRKRQVDLDTPASVYLPELQESELAPVTVRQFLRHRSGLPRTGNFLAPFSRDVREPEFKTALAKLGRARLRWQPGTVFRYANSNYVVVAALIERLSHEPFPSYMQTHIFGPLGMKHTTILYQQALDWGLAEQHEWQWGKVQASPPRFFGWYGASLVRSTAEDIGEYVRAWLGLQEGVIPPTGWWNDDRATDYEWGWFIRRHADWLNAQLVLEHSGDVWGSNAAIVLAPQAEMGVGVLINMGAERALDVTRAVLAETLGIRPQSARAAPITGRPDFWAMIFVAASTLMFALVALYTARALHQVRLGIRAFDKEPVRLVRAIVLGTLGVILIYLLLSDFTPPLAVFPATIQTALPLLVVAVCAVLVCAAASGIFPKRTSGLPVSVVESEVRH